jgi:hypothetical protein
MIRNLAVAVAVASVLTCGFAFAEAFSPQAHSQTLERIAGLVEKNYVYKNVAESTAATLRDWKNDPVLVHAEDQRSFAAILTERLQKIDGHFYVGWSALVRAPVARKPDSGVRQVAFEREMARDNYGFQDVSRLPGNIGYIRMDIFAPFDAALTGSKTPAARKAGEAALALVANSDAVIFDIRENHGGSPAMIDLLLSGFFGEKPVLLNRFYERKGDKTVDFTTLANFKGVRRPNVPLYVLISGATTSAAEGFAYEVQSQKRGLLIGQVTYGGANPGDTFDAGDGFSVFISTGAAIDPITHTNWELVGVRPDVAVPSNEALARAEELALQRIVAKPGAAIDARWALERIEAEQNGAKLALKSSRDFVGSYGDRQVALENGTLVYRFGRYPEQNLIPLGNDAFVLDTRTDVRLSFRRDATGRVKTLVIAGSDGSISTHGRSPTTR